MWEMFKKENSSFSGGKGKGKEESYKINIKLTEFHCGKSIKGEKLPKTSLSLRAFLLAHI